MRLTIIRDDNVVLIDGRAMHVSLSLLLPANLHAVQWDGETGHIEYNDGTPNEALAGISSWQPVVDAWEAARQVEDAPPPTEEERLGAAIAEIYARYAQEEVALNASLLSVLRKDGDAESARVAAIDAKFDTLSQKMNDELLALFT